MDGVYCFHDHVGPGDEMGVNKRACLFRLCSELLDWPLCRCGLAVSLVFSTTFKTNVGANQPGPDSLTCQLPSAALRFLLFLRQVQPKIGAPANHC